MIGCEDMPETISTGRSSVPMLTQSEESKMVNGTDVTVTSGTAIVFGTGLTSGMRVDAVYPH